MTILILGVVYWVWTQNQHIQRKLNLLENIVYEMKSVMSHSEHLHTPDPIESVLAAAAAASSIGESVAPIPTPFVEDDADSVDDALNTFIDAERDTVTPIASEPAEEEQQQSTSIAADEIFEDLTPGGVTMATSEDVSDTNNESVLNAMGLKELRELAKQKGVANPKTLRKQELIAAIRSSKTSVTPFEIREGTLELN